MRIAALISTVLAAAAPAAGQAQPPHARVSLIAETTTVNPGTRDALVGVHFQIDNGWHIYWRNPGGSGTPPSVSSADAGVTFGDIQFPVPTRYDLDGATIYGYERDVVLLVPARFQAPGSDHPEARIAARVGYVICSDVCLRETATPSLTLKVARKAERSDAAPLIEQARSRVPEPMPAGWSARAHLEGDTWALRVTTGRAEPAAVFFPFESGVVDESAAEQVEPAARGLTLHLRKSPYFNKSPSSLAGVLVLPGRGAYRIDAPIR